MTSLHNDILERYTCTFRENSNGLQVTALDRNLEIK